MESEGFAGSNLMIENFRALISVSESLQLLSRQFAKSPIAAVWGELKSLSKLRPAAILLNGYDEIGDFTTER